MMGGTIEQINAPPPHRFIARWGKLHGAYASGVTITLRLDSSGVEEYERRHGISAPIIDGWPGESHNL